MPIYPRDPLCRKAIPVQRVGMQFWADLGLPSSQARDSMRNSDKRTGCRPPPTGKVKRLAFCACFLFPFSWDSRCQAWGDPRSSHAPNPQFQIKRLRPSMVNELVTQGQQTGQNGSLLTPPGVLSSEFHTATPSPSSVHAQCSLQRPRIQGSEFPDTEDRQAYSWARSPDRLPPHSPLHRSPSCVVRQPPTSY